MTTSAFYRLHPNLRHAIVHDLGWRELRPVQHQAIVVILDGSNAVILAPTAGGKTEASLFPVLSNILSSGTPPVAALYVCPLRALLNNQEPRVKRYARMVGLGAFKWHGDVGAADRRRFLEQPTHILMTTPESLEVMLINRAGEAAQLFGALSTVIVDEVHAFAGDDRGAHLASILERLTRFCDRDLQRIGLSATVGNPRDVGTWLAGSSRRPLAVVDPPGVAPPRELSIDLTDDQGQLVAGIAGIARGKKSLVFVGSRSGVEAVTAALQTTEVETFVHHGSVSREDRERAEARFSSGTNVAIVSTSTLELGIDIGDLDHVIQVAAPATVSSVLQRMGRTGRRPGAVTNCHFLCSEPEDVLRAAALIRLMEAGWVEDVVSDDRATHVLAHQIMALSLQEVGVSRHRILPWIAEANPFRRLEADDLTELTETMLAREILYESEGRLTLGREGERLYGGQHFLELYAVFDTPPMFRVRHGRRDVGSLDLSFLRYMSEPGRPALFRLAGRPWAVRDIDWRRHVCFVEPAPRGRVPRWRGQGGYVSYEVCQAMKAVLRDKAAYPWLSRSAAMELESLRLGYTDVVPAGRSAIELQPESATWHTFAGGAINAVLVAALETLGGEWSGGNLGVSTTDREAAAGAPHAVREVTGMEIGEVAVEAARRMPRGKLTKFQPCLPEQMELELMVRRVFDVEGAMRFLQEQQAVVVQR